MTICILISYLIMSYHVQLQRNVVAHKIYNIKDARPGLKRLAQVTMQQMQKKRFKYEKEKRPERIYNAKWCEGRPWLKYDRDENVMTCTICTKYGKRGETGNLKN